MMKSSFDHSQKVTTQVYQLEKKSVRLAMTNLNA